MAELPEVEILVRGLQAAVVGRSLAGAEVVQPEALRFPQPAQLDALLAGRLVTGAWRRAKHILLDLEGDLLLELHCMLYGTLRIGPGGRERPPELLIIFALADGEELHFLDRVGYARAAAGPRAEVITRLKIDALGPELLDPTFDGATLLARLARRRGPLRVALVNQDVVAGLGVRDADESLWLAALDPRRPAPTLDTEQARRLLAAFRTVLDEGLSKGGTMTDLFGRRGTARQSRNVYGRSGEPCPRCATPIAFARLGGRGAYYCPGCQR